MKLKEKARQLHNEIYVLYLCFRDPRVPWYAKAFIITLVAYALSPIDLIPDFIPVLGYIDDVIIIAAGVYLASKMIPRQVREEHRQKVISGEISGRSNWVAAGVVVLVWLLVLFLAVKIIWL